MNEEDNLEIITIKNIADFDFNGANGARFGGRDYLIPAGETLSAPRHAAEHFAKHLAQAILLKESENKDKKDSLPLWDETKLSALIAKIKVSSVREEKVVVKSEDEKMADKIKKLNEKIVDDSSESISVRADSIDGSEDVSYKDKAQVISELDAKGVSFDRRASKTVLEALLK